MDAERSHLWGRAIHCCADKQQPMTRDKTEGRDPAAIEDDAPTEEIAALTDAEIAALEAQEQVEAKADSPEVATGQFEVLRDVFEETWPTASTETGVRAEIGALQFEIKQLRSEVMALRQETKALTELRNRITGESKEATEDPEVNALQQTEFETAETRKLVGQGKHASYEFAIRPGQMRLGSAADNDIPIKSAFISGHHAQILSSSDETILRDMNSTNGTYVNLRRINKCALHDGDSITIGNVSFRFVRKKTAAADVPPVARAERNLGPDRGSGR